MIAASLVIAPSFLRPDPFATLGRRFLSPWLAIDRVGRFLVEVEPGDSVVAVGSDVAFAATVRPRFGNVGEAEASWLEWRDADGSKHRVKMAPDESNTSASRTFRATLPRLAQSIDYSVATDSSASPPYTITAVAPPSVAKISARIEPPAYTKLKSSIAKDAARIEAWEGSSIALTVTPGAPLTSAIMIWPAAKVIESDEEASRSVAMASSDGGTTWTATVPADVSGKYSFKLEDEHHLANRPEPPRRLVVRPDVAPTITLGGRDEPRDAQNDDLLVLDAAARDDLAVDDGRDCLCDREGPIKRPSGSGLGLGWRSRAWARDRRAGEVSLNLKTLDLADGDLVTYRVRVADSLPAPKGPNVTLSEPRDAADRGQGRAFDRPRPLGRTRVAAGAQLTALKKLAAENRQGAQTLRYAADAAQRGNGAWDGSRLDEVDPPRTASAKEVVDKLNVLARDFAESDQYASLTRPTKQIAELEAEAESRDPGPGPQGRRTRARDSPT